MTTYKTGNPIGSTDSRDRLDNTENMDYLENSTTELTHADRLGTVRKTRHGMEVEHDAQIAAHESEHDAQIAAHESEHDAQMQSFESDFDSRLAGMAFTRVGTFTAGATLTDMRQTLLWEVSQGGDGHEYGWTGSFLPSGKVVAAGSTPATSGGVGAGAWVDRSGDVHSGVEERLLGVGAKIYRGSNGQYVQNGDTVPAGTTHLAVLINGKVEDVEINPIPSGTYAASSLTKDSLILNGDTYKLYKTNDPLTLSKAKSTSSFTDATIANRLTTKTFTTEQVKSMADGESFVCINGGSAVLQYLRLTVPVDTSKDLEFYISADLDTDLQIVTNSTDFFLVGAVCDNTNRDHSSVVSLSPVEYIEDGYKLTVPSSMLTKAYFSLDIRLSIGVVGNGCFYNINAKQAGVKVGDSLFNLIRNSDEWSSNTRVATFSEPNGSFRSDQTLDRNVSYLVSSNVLNISKAGKYSYLAKYSSLDFYDEVVKEEASPIIATCLAIQAGNYYPYRKEFPINITNDLALIAVGGKVNLMCSDIVTPTLVSTSNGVSYYTASYDADRHYNDGVRDGSEQPKIGIELILSTESIYKYQLTNVNSQAEVEATAKSYWYDYSTETLHISYPESYTLPIIHVCNSSNGINEYDSLNGTPTNNIFAFNIHVRGSENNNWRIRPDNYLSYPLRSSKFVSLHACSGLASGIGEGIYISNIDHELIDCNFSCSGNDGFNHHNYGKSFILGGRAWNNAQDGNSHHEQQLGWVVGLSMRYNGAGNATPAFGASVYYKDCESVCASDGLTNKVYAGTLCALAGTQGDAEAWYENCYSDQSLVPGSKSYKTHYMSATLNPGSTSDLTIVAPKYDSLTRSTVVKFGAGNPLFMQK